MDDAWPEHLLARNHPVRTWSSRSDAVWETIRQDYLAGTPARDLCDRYEVALSTLRLKAKEGGWRRVDQTDSDLFPADADRWAEDSAGHGSGDGVPDGESAFDHESWEDLADRARFRLRRAIASGRAAEAASWLRVHERLAALAAAEAAPTALPREPGPAPEPDRLDAATALADQIGSLARRAARATTDAEFAAIEAGMDALQARTAGLSDNRFSANVAAALDSLDALDPGFSDPAEGTGPVAGLSP